MKAESIFHYNSEIKIILTKENNKYKLTIDPLNKSGNYKEKIVINVKNKDEALIYLKHDQRLYNLALLNWEQFK